MKTITELEKEIEWLESRSWFRCDVKDTKKNWLKLTTELKTLQQVCEEIEKEITKYKKGKLEDSNFTVEDRAVSMVVLQTLLKKFQGEEE